MKRNIIIAIVALIALLAVFVGIWVGSSDTDVNQERNNISKTQNNYDEEDTAILMAPYAVFTIVNDKGEALECNGGALSGDMEVLAWQYTPADDAVNFLTVKVPTSDWFEYSVPDDADSDFFVTAQQYGGGAWGHGIQNIRVSTDNTVAVNGSDMEYTLMSNGNQAGNYYFIFRGHAESNFAVQVSGDCLHVSGLSGQTTMQFCDYDGRQTEEQEITFDGQDATINLTIHDDCVIADIAESNQKVTANWLE